MANSNAKKLEAIIGHEALEKYKAALQDKLSATSSAPENYVQVRIMSEELFYDRLYEWENGELSDASISTNLSNLILLQKIVNWNTMRLVFKHLYGEKINFTFDNTNLKNADINRKILLDLESGMSVAAVAEKYGKSKNAIYCIRYKSNRLKSTL